MKKYYLRIYQIAIVIVAITVIVFTSLFIARSDEIVTENLTLKYFETSLNNYDKDELKEFSADSENDILYLNLINEYSKHRREDITDYKFTIDSYESFGSGKYQCYLNLKNVPTCDLNHEGRYMNYLIETTTTYTNQVGEKITLKERGIVVFVKDGSNGNLFEWKLVRYNTRNIEE